MDKKYLVDMPENSSKLEKNLDGRAVIREDFSPGLKDKGCYESVPRNISTAVSLQRPAFVLLKVPEGRHNVAHRLNGGTPGAIN